VENIKDSFRVDTPLETTWKTLLDIERIAPSMPGAQLQEVEGDEYRGIVKVKVGPITAQYKGAAKLAEVDEATRTIKIDAAGRDTRGQGNASANITVMMRDDNGGTAVDIDTALQVTGKVAQFGRGVMAEVSAKILKQFVDNLERDVLSSAAQPAAATGTVSTAPEPSNGNAPAGASAANGSGGVRVIDSPEAEPVDLMDAAGASVAKRAIPAFIGLLLVFVVVRRVRRRRRRHGSA
jgi:carbon monoxide dehydrogenase subunit G